MMMRRRAMRRGPSLIGVAATTAVVAGTASAVSHGTQQKMAAGDAAAQQQQAAQAAAAQQQQAAQAAAAQQQAEVDQMQAQQAAMQAQQAAAPPPPQTAAPAAAAPPAASGLTADGIAHLQQLGQLKDAGVLTEDEFAAEKAKILNP